MGSVSSWSSFNEGMGLIAPALAAARAAPLPLAPPPLRRKSRGSEFFLGGGWRGHIGSVKSASWFWRVEELQVPACGWFRK